MSRRLCLALDLVDDAALIAEYDAHHAAGAVWPEVTADISASGIESMEIWRVKDRCMMIIDVSNDYPRPKPALNRDIVDRWDALMLRYQKPLPGSLRGETWSLMQRIYKMPNAKSNE